MKKVLALLLAAALALSFGGCAHGLTGRKGIVALYRKNEAAFATAVETGDYAAVKKLRGVADVTVRDGGEEIEFYCGGAGLVPGSSYWGIRWEKDPEVFAALAAASPEWSFDGTGYRFEQAEGDNRFYYEPLGNGFFYYEEHY